MFRMQILCTAQNPMLGFPSFHQVIGKQQYKAFLLTTFLRLCPTGFGDFGHTKIGRRELYNHFRQLSSRLKRITFILFCIKLLGFFHLLTNYLLINYKHIDTFLFIPYFIKWLVGTPLVGTREFPQFRPLPLGGSLFGWLLSLLPLHPPL